MGWNADAEGLCKHSMSVLQLRRISVIYGKIYCLLLWFFLERRLVSLR